MEDVLRKFRIIDLSFLSDNQKVFCSPVHQQEIHRHPETAFGKENMVSYHMFQANRLRWINGAFWEISHEKRTTGHPKI